MSLRFKLSLISTIFASTLALTSCATTPMLSQGSSATNQTSGSMASELNARVGFYCDPNLCHLIIENVSERPVDVRGELCGRIGGEVYQGRHRVSATLNPGSKGDIDFTFLGSYGTGSLSKIWLGDCDNEDSARLVWMNPASKIQNPGSGSSSNGSTNSNSGGTNRNNSGAVASPTPESRSGASDGNDDATIEDSPDFASIIPDWLSTTRVQIESFSTTPMCDASGYPSTQFCGVLSLRLNNLDELLEHRVSVSGKVGGNGINPYFEFVFEPGQTIAEDSVVVHDWLSSSGDIVDFQWSYWTIDDKTINRKSGNVEIPGTAEVVFDFDPLEHFVVANKNFLEDRFALQDVLEEGGLCLGGRNVFLLGTGQHELFRCSGSDVYPYNFSTVGSVKEASTLSSVRRELSYDFCLYGKGWHSCSDFNSDDADFLNLLNELQLPWVWARYSSDSCPAEGCRVNREDY